MNFLAFICGKVVFVRFLLKLTSKAKPGSKGKVITAKVTGRSDATRSSLGSGQGTLAPPMSSVLVERHQPVVKVGKFSSLTVSYFHYCPLILVTSLKFKLSCLCNLEYC